jgi:chemotaxis protein CheD
MNPKSKTQGFNPAVLPMEYLPRIPYASDDKHTRHYLIPGKIFVAAQPFAISTIVGSGIALCLWDSVHHIGGANHFMLPEGPDDNANATRYGNIANPTLLQKLQDLGAEVKSLEAKIFGGSLPNVTFNNTEGHLGDRNVEVVTRFLNLNGIRLVQSDVGGTRGRKVIFQTDDGRTWTEQL